jgi:YidC/Oxa1 family membrane protein insertase
MDLFHLIWQQGLVYYLTTGLAYLITMSGSAALGIVAFTIITRIVLLPLSVMQVRSQKKMLALQPELKAIQKRYAKDSERRMQEQMRLYKENGVQPALGCLPLVLQLPILFGLYSALSSLAYSQVPSYAAQYGYLTDLERSAAHFLTDRFLYLCSLAGPDGIPMRCSDNPLDPANFLVIAGVHVPGPLLLVMTVLSFVVQRMMVMPSADPQQQQMNRMMAFMPLMYLFFFSSVPAGLVLYWLVTNVVSIVQQYLIAGRGSLFPGSSSAAPAPATAAAAVEDTPAPNGTDGATPERRPAARSGKRTKRGRS